MIPLYDLHTHTTFCDGKSTPEEMAESAAAKGFKTLGFSAHSPISFDDGCMKAEDEPEYRKCISAMKGKYSDRLCILLGIERDMLSPTDGFKYDFTVGSAHYIPVSGGFVPVDWSAGVMEKAVKEHFGGDFYKYTDAYFSEVSRVAAVTKCDIIAHFDLVSKFNEGGRYFDEECPRYLAAAKEALRELVKYGVPFEINTGAVARKNRLTPYPSQTLLKEIRSLGGDIVISGDTHSAADLGRYFTMAVSWAKAAGFTCARFMSPDEFANIPL